MATSTLDHGRAWVPQPLPLTQCVPNLSSSEGTMTKACFLEALAQTQTTLCQASSAPEDSVPPHPRWADLVLREAVCP